MSSQIVVNKISQNDSKRWNNLLFNSINGSYRQSFPFEYVQELNGREISTYIFQKDGVDIAGVHYSIKGAYNNFITTADILSGFVFREEPNQELLAFLIEHFINWAKEKKVSYLRINPWLSKTIVGDETQYTTLFEEEMNRFGFKNILSGRHTYWINLTLSEEQLLAKMKRQTRYDVRQGIKSAIRVVRHDQPTNHLFDKFWNLYSSLGIQKGFGILSKQRFKQEVISLMESGLASLFFASFDDQVVNISFASNFGRASYLYGAMNPDFKKLQDCPSPGPLAQWEMIMSMKSKGVKIYDMGFCPGPIPIKGHPQYHIWRFKYGFGGDHVEFLPTYGKALQPVRGRLFQYLRYKK